MPKKTIKIIFVILLIVVIFLESEVFAMSVTDLSPQYTTESKDAVGGIGQELLGVIRNISVIASVVILAFIGLKIMFGSVEQKADYKKSLVPLAIGIIVVMSATTITSLVWRLNTEQETEAKQETEPEQECQHEPIEFGNGRIKCKKCGKKLE